MTSFPTTSPNPQGAPYTLPEQVTSHPWTQGVAVAAVAAPQMVPSHMGYNNLDLHSQAHHGTQFPTGQSQGQFDVMQLHNKPGQLPSQIGQMGQLQSPTGLPQGLPLPGSQANFTQMPPNFNYNTGSTTSNHLLNMSSVYATTPSSFGPISPTHPILAQRMDVHQGQVTAGQGQTCYPLHQHPLSPTTLADVHQGLGYNHVQPPLGYMMHPNSNHPRFSSENMTYVSHQHPHQALQAQLVNQLHQYDVTDGSPQIPAPPHTYIPEPIDPHKNTLPLSLPTTLNSSLQIKSGSRAPPSAENGPLLQSPTSPAQPSPPFHSSGLIRSSWDSTKVEGQDDQTTSGMGSSISSSMSPPGSSPTSPHLGRTDLQWVDSVVPMYESPVSKDTCLKCGQRVYQMEQLGPIKDVVYHKLCFTCVVCGTRLNLKNFHHNPNDMDDLNVFCASHKPKDRSLSCDASAVLIKTALSAPRLDRVNEQIRGDHLSNDVLARLGHTVPSASAHRTALEQAYYAMAVAENQYQQQHLSQSVLNRDHIVDPEQTGYISAPSQNITPGYDVPDGYTTSGTSQSCQTDDVFIVQAGGGELCSSNASNAGSSSLRSSTSSVSSSSVALTRSDRPSAESIAEEMAVQLSLTSDRQPEDPEQPSTDVGSTKHDDATNERQTDEPSEAADDRSSCMLPPQPQCDNDASSGLPSNGDNKQKVCGAKSRVLRFSTPSLERADRPSNPTQPTIAQDGTVSQDHRVLIKSASSGDMFDSTRYLAKNEIRRVDRPSQFP